MTIAVTLCTYNGERYLPAQLRSLLDQSRLPDQIVMVDDDSSDATWPILGEFVKDAERAGIKVLQKRNERNLGYVRNFERAISLATADLVFLCDQDDIWHPRKIERMEKEFASHPNLLLLHTDARLVDNEGKDMGCGLFEACEASQEEIAHLHAGMGFKVLLRRNLVTGATAAFRRSVLRYVSPFPSGWVHDEWLGIVCASRGQIDCLEEKLIDYRQHGGNQIGVRRRTFMDKIKDRRISRRDHMRRLSRRLEEVADRFTEVDGSVPAEYMYEFQQRLCHVRAREGLPKPWMKRWLWVAREVRSGRYGRYSSGLRSIMADLLGLD